MPLRIGKDYIRWATSVRYDIMYGTRKVKDFMEKDPAVVDYEGTLSDVIGAMLEKGRTGVMVKEGTKIAGVITSSDLMSVIIQGKDPSLVKISDFMTACSLVGENPCVQIGEDSMVIDALRVMQLGRTGRVVVVDSRGKFTGVIGFLEALRAWQEDASKAKK
jgi:predicted transcriptional regulator